MKKLILALIITFAYTSSFAQMMNLRERRLEANAKIHSKINGSTKMVPTIFKEILWSESANKWDTSFSNCYHLNYLNNHIFTRYNTNYTGKDTLFKYEYIYDNQDNLIQINKFHFDVSDSTYHLWRRELYTYDNDYLKTISITQEFDINTQTWLNKLRKIVEFDYNGNLIFSRLEDFTANAWRVQNYFGKGYTYLNNTKKIVVETDSVFSSITKKTFANNKNERVYNNLEQLIEIKFYYYQNNALNLGTIANIEYNSQGIPIQEVYHIADQFPILTPTYKFDSLTWLNFNPDIDYFENILLSRIDSIYQDSLFIFYGKLIGEKLDNNNSYTIAQYIVKNNVLKKSSRYDYIFDVNKNLIEMISYTVNTNNEWKISDGNRYLIAYDVDKNITEYIEQRYRQNQFVNFIKNEYINYITIEVTSGLYTSKTNIKPIIYPNPSNDGRVLINVNMEVTSTIDIKVFDLNGRVMQTQIKYLNKGLNSIELNGLEQGVYVLELRSEFVNTRTKLIIN